MNSSDLDLDAVDAALMQEIDRGWAEDWTSPPIRVMARAIGRTPSATYKRLAGLVAGGHLVTRKSGDKVVYKRRRP